MVNGESTSSGNRLSSDPIASPGDSQASRNANSRTRLEVLEGYLVAYLNLDEVIRIIREEDHPNLCLAAAW